MNEDMARIIKQMEQTERRRNQELTKLCQDPDIYSVALVLTDAFMNSLAYLCHFQRITDGFGEEIDIQELLDVMECKVKENFEKLTGQEYQSETCRTIDFVEGNNGSF